MNWFILNTKDFGRQRYMRELAIVSNLTVMNLPGKQLLLRIEFLYVGNYRKTNKAGVVQAFECCFVDRGKLVKQAIKKRFDAELKQLVGRVFYVITRGLGGIILGIQAPEFDGGKRLMWRY